jgi:hypothetical protein
MHLLEEDKSGNIGESGEYDEFKSSDGGIGEHNKLGNDKGKNKKDKNGEHLSERGDGSGNSSNKVSHSE